MKKTYYTIKTNESKQKVKPLSVLPDDALRTAFAFLTPGEKARVRHVNRRFQALLEENHVWEKHYHELIPNRIAQQGFFNHYRIALQQSADHLFSLLDSTPENYQAVVDSLYGIFFNASDN